VTPKSCEQTHGSNGNSDRPLAVAPAEAARLIGCGRTTLYLLLSNGDLPSFTLGRRRLIRVSAIEAWLSARESNRT
jgi:excisionase family DNA binding protein